MAYRGVVRLSLPLSALALVLAACGGSNVGAPLVAVPNASPTAPPIPAAAPFSASTSNPLPAVTAPPVGQTPAPVPVPVPSAAGYAGTFALPISGVSSIAANTTAVVTLSNQAPSGTPTTFARGRNVLRRYDASTALAPMLYLQLLFSGNVSIANQPAITFQVPASNIVSGASYYIALYDSSRPTLGWQLGFEGPGVVSGNSIAFAGGAGSFTFDQFTWYIFALYAQSAAAPTPTAPPTASPTPVPTATPSPGASPTPIPTPGFGVTPTSISLNGAGATQAIVATGTAPYFAVSSDASIATVSPANGNSPFTVTAVKGGTAQITIVDSTGLKAIIPVTVTTTTIPVQ
jgi:hypothetical protein